MARLRMIDTAKFEFLIVREALSKLKRRGFYGCNGVEFYGNGFYLRDNFNSIEYTEMKTLCYDSLYDDPLSRNLKGSYYSVRITLLLMFKAL